jgi:hypothetical protein
MAQNTIGRAAMEQAIRSGGSVMYQGRLITAVEQLPSAAELAAGDPAAEAEAQTSLQTQIAELQRQMAQLEARQQPGGTKKTPAKGEKAEGGEVKE